MNGRAKAVAFALMLILVLSSTAPLVRSSTPASGTITLTSPTVAWSGSTLTNDPLFQAGLFSPSFCGAQKACDGFTLLLSIPSTLGSTNPGYFLNISLRWASPLNQYGLYVVNTAGAIIAVSLLGNVTQQFFMLYQPPPGTYAIYADSLQTVPGTPYTGSATLTLNQFNWISFPRTATYFDQTDKSAATPFVITPDLRLVGSQGGTGFSQDGEPEIQVNQFGTIYASAINGVPGGTDFWRSTDGGQTFTYLGQPDGTQSSTTAGVAGGGAGGGDDNLLIGSPFVLLNQNGIVVNSTGRVYDSSLWLGSSTVASSIDQGNHWIPSQSPVAAQDRQWGVAVGPSTYYISTNELVAATAGVTNLVIVESTDGGLTFPRGAFIGHAAGSNVSNFQGPLAVGPDGTIYAVYVPPGLGNNIMLAKCPGPCTLPLLPMSATNTPFTAHEILKLPPLFYTENVFPQVAVDNSGNVYVSFSDGRNVYLMSSTDGGTTWSTPVRVNNGPEAFSTLEPTLHAGDDGRVGVMFLGTSTPSYNPNDFEANAQAQWHWYYSFTPDALDSTPAFYQTVISGGSDLPDGVNHVGPVCTNGLACPPGTRNLIEYSSFAIDNFGMANFVFAEDRNTLDGNVMTDFVQQTAGPTFFAPSLGRAVGQGHVTTANGATVHFEFKVDSRSSGLSGQLQVLDQTNQFQVSSLSIDSFTISGNQATFTGTALFNNGVTQTTVSFSVKVLGNQGLNSGGNTFSITLSNGYAAAGSVQKGNIIVTSA